MSRLTQKQIEKMFYECCEDAGIPTTKSRRKSKTKYRTGCFHVGGAYGKMCIEYELVCGGISSVSGYLNARDMYNWLANFDPKRSYKEYRAYEKRVCLTKEQRLKRR